MGLLHVQLHHSTVNFSQVTRQLKAWTALQWTTSCTHPNRTPPRLFFHPPFISCQAKNGPFTVRPPECTITSRSPSEAPPFPWNPYKASLRERQRPPTPPSTFIPRPSNCCGDNYSRMRSTCCASTAFFSRGEINALLANLCGERWWRQESEAEEDASRERDKTPPPFMFAEEEERGVIITLRGFWILQLLSSVC